MTRLHVAEGGRVVTMHIDVINGEGVLRHRKDLGNQPIGGPSETVGADDLAGMISLRGLAQKDIDLIDKNRAEDFPVVRVNVDPDSGRFMVSLDLFPIHQSLSFFTVRHNVPPFGFGLVTALA
jgi:hypothetical protein